MVVKGRVMKKFKVIMKQVCKQEVEVEAASREDATKQVILGRGKVVSSDFRPSLSPDSWQVEEIK